MLDQCVKLPHPIFSWQGCAVFHTVMHEAVAGGRDGTLRYRS